MNFIFKHKKTFLRYGLVLLLGGLASSTFWYFQLQQTTSLLNYRNFEIGNLKEQITALRTDYQQVTRPKPRPITSIPFTPKETLSRSDAYSIRCLDDKTRDNDPFFQKIQTSLNKDEEIGAFCYNLENKKAILLKNKENAVGPYNSSEYLITFDLYNMETGNKESWPGNTLLLYQKCQEVTDWQKSGFGIQEAFFIRCASPTTKYTSSTTKTLYQIIYTGTNLNPLIIEKCTTTQQGYPEVIEKTTCATYQDYQQCSKKGLL